MATFEKSEQYCKCGKLLEWFGMTKSYLCIENVWYALCKDCAQEIANSINEKNK